MHEDARAYRTAVAINKLVAAVEQLAPESGLSDEDKDRLVNQLLYPRAYDPNDQRCLQLEAAADIAEAFVTYPASAEADEYDFTPVVGKSGNDALHEAGYKYPEEVQNASDEELMDIQGLGAKKVSNLRAVFPKA